MRTKVTVHNHFGSTSTRDADVKIVYNKLLGGWYVVRGPSQAPLSGRFNTEEEAKMWLLSRKNARDGVVEEYLAGVDEKLKQLPNASARRRFVEEQERGFMQRYADFQRRAASNGRIYPGETAWAYSATLRGLAQRLNQTGDVSSSGRDPDQSDLDSAARGLNMLSKRPSELRQLIAAHSGSSLFASRVITAAAKQMLAAKLRMGAQDAPRWSMYELTRKPSSFQEVTAQVPRESVSGLPQYTSGQLGIRKPTDKFTNLFPPFAFILDGRYLVSTEGYDHCRYVARIS